MLRGEHLSQISQYVYRMVGIKILRGVVVNIRARFFILVVWVLHLQNIY